MIRGPSLTLIFRHFVPQFSRAAEYLGTRLA